MNKTRGGSKPSSTVKLKRIYQLMYAPSEHSHIILGDKALLVLRILSETLVETAANKFSIESKKRDTKH